MKTLSVQLKFLLSLTLVLFCGEGLMAQSKKGKESREYKNFTKITNRAGISFTLPEEFKELPVTPSNSNYDFGMNLPNADFEIWFKVSPSNENTTDSSYLETGKNTAKQLAGESNFFMRPLSDKILNNYNADAGKTYFISLPDAPGTTHYKYALLITLQKSHKGTVMAVCLTNDKGPDFFKNITKASNCLKFKSGT